MEQLETDLGHHIGGGVYRHREDHVSNPGTKNNGEHPPTYELEQELPVNILRGKKTKILRV